MHLGNLLNGVLIVVGLYSVLCGKRYEQGTMGLDELCDRLGPRSAGGHHHHTCPMQVLEIRILPQKHLLGLTFWYTPSSQRAGLALSLAP
uniref:Secreted protein n=1 Tax=Oryza rufipogon TaxID=4529 RepID=A0A0E0PS67_ORYRU